jgi:hypothetical protein
MDTIEKHQEGFATNVYPPVSYTPDRHFGGSGAHLLKANCDIKQYETAEQFVENDAGK